MGYIRVRPSSTAACAACGATLAGRRALRAEEEYPVEVFCGRACLARARREDADELDADAMLEAEAAATSEDDGEGEEDASR